MGGTPAGHRRLPERLDGPPCVSARAWAIADGKTGKVLWEHDGSVRRQTASLAKIMTGWIVAELAREDPGVLDEVATVSRPAQGIGGTTAQLRAGDRGTVRSLLYGLMLPSGNDAAITLAEHFGARFARVRKETGSRRQVAMARFVAEMNRRARALALAKTRYINPHGLGLNLTSARDLARLTFVALKNSLLREIVNVIRRRATYRRRDGSKRTVTLKNTNRLLAFRGYDGVKTGRTQGAKYCVVGSGRRGADRLLVVVLGSSDIDARFVDARNLFRWAWTQRRKQ